MTTDDHPSDPAASEARAAEERLDAIARSAGAELRRPAPRDAMRALEDRRRVQVRARAVMAAGAGAVLVIGMIGAFALRSDDPPATGNEDQRPTATTVAATSAVPGSVPTVTTAPATTSSAPPTTEAPPTTAALQPETRWAVDYVGGAAAEAVGDPVRIGLANSPGTVDFARGADAAVKFLNAELGGIGGRPVEFVTCPITGSEDAATCGAGFRDDPDLAAVLVGDVGSSEFYDAIGPAKAMLIAWSNGDMSPVAPAGTAVDLSPGLNPFHDGGVWWAGMLEFLATRLANPVDKITVISPGPGAAAFLATKYPGVAFSEAVIPSDDPQQVVDAITSVGGEDSDAFMLLVPGDLYCVRVAQALELMNADAAVITWDPCGGEPMKEMLAASGAGGEAPDGWYFTTTGDNPQQPTLESGWLTTTTKIEQYSPGARGDGPGAFAGMLTLAKLMNANGGATASTEALRTALASFTGPMMLQAGPLACGRIRYFGGPAPVATCAGQLGIVQYRDGGWVTLDPVDTQD